MKAGKELSTSWAAARGPLPEPHRPAPPFARRRARRGLRVPTRAHRRLRGPGTRPGGPTQPGPRCRDREPRSYGGHRYRPAYRTGAARVELRSSGGRPAVSALDRDRPCQPRRGRGRHPQRSTLAATRPHRARLGAIPRRRRGHEGPRPGRPRTCQGPDRRAGRHGALEPVELEERGRRHTRDFFDLSELQARMGGVDWIDDTEFAAYELDDKAIARLRQWAQTWADDTGERLHELESPTKIKGSAVVPHPCPSKRTAAVKYGSQRPHRPRLVRSNMQVRATELVQEPLLPKLRARVRLSSPAPSQRPRSATWASVIVRTRSETAYHLCAVSPSAAGRTALSR